MQQRAARRQQEQLARVRALGEGGLVVLARAHLAHEDEHVGRGEGALQREQLEEHDAQRPHVGRLAVRLARENLRAEVVGRAAHGRRQPGVRVVEGLGEAKVAEHCAAALREADVLGV